MTRSDEYDRDKLFGVSDEPYEELVPRGEGTEQISGTGMALQATRPGERKEVLFRGEPYRGCGTKEDFDSSEGRPTCLARVRLLDGGLNDVGPKKD
jgi:hypothetical protein